MRDNDELAMAVNLATAWHGSHPTYDLAGLPIIVHVTKVAGKMSTPKLQAVAWLHDVLEDTPATAQELLGAGISAEVVEAVEAITRQDGEPYADYIERVSKNIMATMVKIVDLEHNLDATRLPMMTNSDYARMHRYRKALKVLKATLASWGGAL